MNQLRPLTIDEYKNKGIVIPSVILTDKTVPVRSQFVDQIFKFIQTIDRIRNNSEYIQDVLSQDRNQVTQVANRAILNSFDFHLTSEGPKLIEVNTNAAFSSMGSLLQASKNVSPNFGHFFEEFANDIKSELILFFKSNVEPKILIVDQNLENQFAAFEMFLFQDFFESLGWFCKVRDLQEVEFDGACLKDSEGNQFNFVYNRHTDFLFAQPESKHLKAAFDSKKICFSPNPFEYLLLAHKERLIQWNQRDLLEKYGLDESEIILLNQTIPRSFVLKKENSKDAWENRKKLFFKPLAMFGSKGVYRGESISKSKFETLLEGEYLAQEYFPAPEFDGFKYDLRVYTYQKSIRMMLVRLYQGQVTNMRTPGGGLGLIAKI
ncbi:MAG: hypothetical protein KDD25_07015 [Bdellovibrionales bacterium]|nr:hypothetical protein [Bdellovibrionales bacterium]